MSAPIVRYLGLLALLLHALAAQAEAKRQELAAIDARYEAVTLDRLKAVARKYLLPEALVISIVQPAQP